MSNQVDSAAEIWAIAALRLHKKLHENTFQQWFANIVPVQMEDLQIQLGVSDDFFGDCLRENYSALIAEALTNIDGTTYDFKIISGYLPAVVNASAGDSTALPVNDAPRFDLPNASPSEIPGTAPDDDSELLASANGDAPLRTESTFSNFVVGEENRYAYTAAHTVAESPGIYNPLYIHGGTGTGKTHLLHSITKFVHAANPKAVIKYMTCEEFLNNYVEAINHKRFNEFRNAVRKVDMLLIDDVHALSDKKQLQEEFFNTFNTLHNLNRQIILTSDKAPCEIKGLENRLVSRFESGLTCEIHAPGLETRLAILKMMQENPLVKVKLSDEVLFFIASNISASVRRLRGAFLQSVAFASAMSTEMTIELAENVLRSVLIEERSSKTISIELIKKTVAEYFDIRLSDIMSDKRPKNIAEPRMIAMYLSRKLTKQSFPEIGEAFGKNHATIINAVNKVPELCKKNNSISNAITQIERQLQINPA